MKLRPLVLFLFVSTFHFSAQADMSGVLSKCDGYLMATLGVVGKITSAPFKLLDIPSRNRLRSKFEGRDINNLIQIGTRDPSRVELDLSNLYLDDAELNHLVEFLKKQNTASVTHLNLNFNPALTRTSVDHFFRLFPNVTHLYLENVHATAHKLHLIADVMPKLEALRLSFLAGEDVYPIQTMRKLTFLDLSTVKIRSSERWIVRNEETRYPSVSLDALKQIIRNNRGRIKTLLIPPLNMANDEGVQRLAEQSEVRLFAPTPAYKTEFIDQADEVLQKGIKIKVNGKIETLYLPGLILPDILRGQSREFELASLLEEFLRAMAREKVEGYLVGPFAFSKDVVYADVMFRRMINGEFKLFSLRNVIEHMNLGVAAQTTWKTHLTKEKPDFVPQYENHMRKRAAGIFDKLGPLK